MKKLLAIFTVFSLCFALMPKTTIHAKDDLEDYLADVIGGFGTIEDPFILKEDSKYKMLFDEIAINKINLQPIIGNGAMQLSYAMSYQGYWNQSTVLVVWDKYPLCYIPDAYYGVGTFTLR